MNIKLIPFKSLAIFLLVLLATNTIFSQNKKYSLSKQVEIHQKMGKDYQSLIKELSQVLGDFNPKCSELKEKNKKFKLWKKKQKSILSNYYKEENKYSEELKNAIKNWNFKGQIYRVEKVFEEYFELCANIGESKIIKTESELNKLVSIHQNYEFAANRYEHIKKSNSDVYKWLLEFKNSKEFETEYCERYLVGVIKSVDEVDERIIKLQKYVDSININFKKLPIEKQQLSKTKENYFNKYAGFITKVSNIDYGKPLSTEYIRNEIAIIRKALNCYNEVTSKITYHEYANKKIKTVGSLWGDKRTGKWTSYYPDGKIQSNGYYLNDQLSGYYDQFDEDGSRTVWGAFKNDERIGQWTFIENGIRSTGVYKNDNQDGIWEEYYKNNKLKSKTTFVNGDKVGWYEEYLPNGSPTKKGNYRKVKEAGSFGGTVYISKPKGIWNYWDYHSDGQLRVKKTTDEDTGFDIGNYEKYYENGELQEKGKYVSNKRDGEWYFNIDFKRNKYLREFFTKEGKYKVIFKNGKPIKHKDVNSQYDSMEDE